MKYIGDFIQELQKPRKGFRGFLTYYDEDGKRRKVSKMLDAATKTQAKRELAKWRSEMEEQAAQEAKQQARPTGLSAKATVPDYVADMVKRLEESKAIEPSTVAGYQSTLKHIAAAFSDVAVKDLTAAQIQNWEAELSRRGLSSSTVGKAHRLLKQAMKEAFNLGIIDRNPCDAVKPPKKKPKKPGINALDQAGRTQLLSILEASELTPLTVAAYIALYTGLRRGEICALRWCDVDLEGGVLWVRQAIGMSSTPYLKQTKTDRVRDVALPQSLINILTAWKAQQSAQRAQIGAFLDPQGFIIGIDQKPIDPDLLGKQWHSLAKQFNIKGTEGRLCTFHDLRHTWATMAVAAGVDIKTVSSNLGHANAAMTLNIYASADPDAKRRAARTVEEIIKSPIGTTLPFKKAE